ncbi:MarR family transcriptional regulator [Sphingomonas sp.]|uniref:MarR family winged helix-turn-helix transcriptional regulator n=1 Tax=Sphingomonas sp. TaxID=28214 RepID=UPI001B04B119|nr:MarR family transcriptional regulator [Sphingomonas sp.]MBO9711777.1 MarR family transcriptional regulator [Sphingomonas sp.]
MGNTDETTSERKAPSILHLVKQVQYKAYVRLESVLQPLGVTAVQFRILTTLSTRPNVSSAELARLYDVKPQTMIKQIALLEAKGLIDRQVSRENKRLLELSLTKAGRTALEQLQTDTQALEAELLQPLGEREQEALRGYLARLLESLSAVVVDAEEHDDAEEFTQEYRRPGVQRL